MTRTRLTALYHPQMSGNGVRRSRSVATTPRPNMCLQTCRYNQCSPLTSVRRRCERSTALEWTTWAGGAVMSHAVMSHAVNIEATRVGVFVGL